MKVGVHQGSALSSLSFIVVMDVLSEDIRNVSLMELLHTHNLAFC